MPGVIFVGHPAYNDGMLTLQGGIKMDIDDLIFGDADPGPSSR